MILTIKGRRVSTKKKSIKQLKRLIKCLNYIKRDNSHPEVADFCIIMLHNKIERMLVSYKTNTN